MKFIGQTNRIGGVMVSMLNSSTVYRGCRTPAGSNQRLWNWYLLIPRRLC